ncbi:glycoprotein [Rhodococcus sp. NPDC054953]
MRTALRRLAATTLTALALAAPLGHPALAGAAPAGTAADHTQRADQSQQFVSLSVDSVTPGTVTTSSVPTVTVTGTVRNVGDRAVSDLQMRLQRGPMVATPTALRTVLTAGQDDFDTVGPFTRIRDRLDVGQSAGFTVALPLRSTESASLNIDEPGVYPLLVNVNGTPEYGGTARLDDARFLLPVLGVPRDPTVSDSDAGPVPPSTSDPVAVTLMWPLADRPRLAAGITGSADEKPRLVDDELAASLAQGGRLEQLVAAADFATGDDLDRDQRLRQSMCLAVDPDLLVTVDAMSRGYLVVDDPADPTGPAREGTGQAAATEWLGTLRQLASRMCVTALPYAQTDLTALHRVGDATLTARALSRPADLVDGLLGVTSVRGLTWPDSGVLDPAAAAELSGLGPTALLAANTVPDATGQPKVPLDGGNNGDPLYAALFDVSAATALAAVGATPQTPTFTPDAARYDLTEDSRTARLQDAIGAMTWEALTARSTGARMADAAPRSLLLVPPQQWTPDGDEARAVLSVTSTMLRSGLAVPRSVPEILDHPASPPPLRLTYPDQAVKDGAPATVADAAAASAPEIDALTETLVYDPQSTLTPDGFTGPLEADLLRAMSTSGRRDSDRSIATATAEQRVAQVRSALDRVYGSVTVLAPGGAYTLASEQSPLLFVARNDLPVGITVRLRLSAPDGMTITDIGDQQLPARGSRALQVPAQVTETGKMVVDVALTTVTGRELGEPTSVSVRSNSYGKLLAIITGCAGALLLLLAGRRLWHRFRGQPDPADEGYEGP